MASRTIGVWIVLFLAIGFSGGAAGLDYVGLRITVPLGSVPFLFGIDLGTRVPSGWAFATLLLDATGRTLLFGTYEFKLAGGDGVGTSFVVLSAGIVHFDPRVVYPSPVFGGGLSYRFDVAKAVQAGLTGEILYPLGLGPPFFTLQGGWSAP